MGYLKDEFTPPDQLADKPFFAGKGGVGFEDSVNDFGGEDEATIDEWTEEAVPERVVLIVDCIFIRSKVMKSKFNEGVEFFEGLCPGDGPIKFFCVSGVIWEKLPYDLNNFLSSTVGRETGGCGRYE